MFRRKQPHCLFCIKFFFGSFSFIKINNFLINLISNMLDTQVFFSFVNLKSIELYIGLVLIK